jgi:hypothetical protein
MHIENRPFLNISNKIKLMKEHSSKKLKIEFQDLKKKILGSSFLDNWFWKLDHG